MGYGVTAYSVSLKTISSLFKSPEADVRDVAIRYGLAKHCKNEAIVKELIKEGTATNGGLGHEYFYAIEGMMQGIGIPMYARHWYPVRSSTFGLLEGDFQNLNSLLSIDIPEPGDFPWVLALPNDAMTSELSDKLKVKINDDELFEELQSWINQAKEENRDLVLYFY